MADGPSIDCNAWRAQYDTATVADQQRWHSDVWAANPDQSHFSAEPLATAIELIQPRTVIELGGWDGEAACTMLDRYPFIEHWMNVEICREAVKYGRRNPHQQQLSLAGRYLATCPTTSWYWDMKYKTDLFVGNHVIEHLRSDHLEAVIDATDTPAFYVEAPLGDGPQSWQGAWALHILELGWSGVTELFARRGYELAMALNVETKPSSGGSARCCLYRTVSDGVS